MNGLDVIRAALESVAAGSGKSGYFLAFMTKHVASETGVEKDQVLSTLFRTLADLRVNVMQRCPVGSFRTVALDTIANVEAFFIPANLGTSIERVVAKSGEVDFLVGNLRLLSDFQDGDIAIRLSEQNVLAELREVVDRCVASDDIDTKTKSLIENNFDLLNYAVSRLKVDGVSSFRKDVFTAAGVLSLELNSKSRGDKAKEMIQDVADAILRIAGLVEVGSGVTGLLGFDGHIAGLIEGPKAESA